jgi:hypothetical protein
MLVPAITPSWVNWYVATPASSTEDVMQTVRWVVTRGIGLIALIVFAAGCATPEPPLPPPMVMKPGDFKRLAGLWTGTAYVQEAAPIEIQGVIYEDGAFTVQERRLLANPVPGSMRIVDGGVRYDSQGSEGTMTFYETPTTWVWKWQGISKFGNNLAVTNELTKPK